MSVVTAVKLASLRGHLIKAVREGRLEVIVACTLGILAEARKVKQ